jgi:hypothetical protein
MTLLRNLDGGGGFQVGSTKRLIGSLSAHGHISTIADIRMGIFLIEFHKDTVTESYSSSYISTLCNIPNADQHALKDLQRPYDQSGRVPEENEEVSRARSQG